MEIKEISRSTNKTMPAEEKAELLKKLRKEHNKLVKGKFEFLDAKGGWIEFNYRFFPEDLLVTYKFYHNEVCEIPMGLVKHINNTTRKIRSFKKELPTKGSIYDTEKESRIRFTPVEFF